MTKTKQKAICQGLFIILYNLGNAAIASAQIVPDATLPSNSIVTPSGNTFVIEGGTQAGSNLFHSFEQFSVPTNGTAFFNNAQTIQNIFSRVTGTSISNIDGLIKANGSASLFLINPNGIIFGRNASLNIGGSFLASTANSIIFNDNSQFSAINPQAPPLLTINVPIGLQFGANPGRIINQSQASPEGATNSIGAPVGLAIFSGQTLALVGGDVNLENGNLAAFGGRIELGSVAGNGIVSLTPTDAGWGLGYEQMQSFGNIKLSQESVVDASGFPPFSPDEEGGRGGDIQVRGNQVKLDNSGISTTNWASIPGGNLTITANSVEVSGTLADPNDSNFRFAAGLFSQTQSSGKAGNLTIATGDLTIRDGAQVSSNTFASGQGGTLSVTASSEVKITGSSVDGTIVSGLFSQTYGSGNAGDLKIATQRLIIQNQAQVSSDTFNSGNAGNLLVQAAESIVVSGRSLIASQVTPEATGAGTTLTVETKLLTLDDGGQISAATAGEQSGGNVIVNTDRLTLVDGGQISALTVGKGRGGTLTVNAFESVEMIGTRSDGFPSGLFTQSQAILTSSGAGDGGNLTVSARRLIVRDGAAISADTFADGQGGTLTVNASESVNLVGTSAMTVPLDFSPAVRPDGRLPSRLTAVTTGTGRAGSLTINTEQLTIQDGATAAVNARLGGGAAGDLEINGDLIRLDRGAIAAETASGKGGNIQLQSQSIQLRGNSRISTTAGTADRPGDGGNITIRTDTIVGLENSDISANSFSGSGGIIDIRTQGIFGLEAKTREQVENLFGDRDISQFDPANLSTSDITAISRTNPSLSGIVAIQTPEIDPTQGIVALPESYAPPEIPQNPCAVGQEEFEFINTGRGGLPPSPREALNLGVARVNERRSSENPVQIVEARGWIKGPNGEIILTADKMPSATPYSSWERPAACGVLSR